MVMFTFYSLGSCETLNKILAVDFVITDLRFNLSCSKGRFPETVNSEQNELETKELIYLPLNFGSQCETKRSSKSCPALNHSSLSVELCCHALHTKVLFGETKSSLLSYYFFLFFFSSAKKITVGIKTVILLCSSNFAVMHKFKNPNSCSVISSSGCVW